MHEGSDCGQNMTLFLLKTFADIKKLQSEEFLLCGYKVKVLLGCDFKFLYDCLDHQGSAATYSSKEQGSHTRKLPRNNSTNIKIIGCQLQRKFN